MLVVLVVLVVSCDAPGIPGYQSRVLKPQHLYSSRQIPRGRVLQWTTMGIRATLSDIAIDADRRWDEARLKLLRLLGGADKLQILGYRGLGNPERLLIKGRVLVSRGSTEHQSDDDLWDDLVKMYRRLDTTEIPGALVRVSAAGAVAEVTTDEEGYFDVELEAVDVPFRSPRQPVELELLEPAGKAEPVVTTAEATIRSPRTSFLVISDLDDTVVHTEATSLLAMARATFLGNARSRNAFPGVGALYTALVDGPSGQDDNPLIFISRSPWNLYDLFDQFCDLQGLPAGRVFFLRDWGFSREGLKRAHARGHKFELIRRVLELEPDLPVILIGDSGQKDPEIYHAISDEYGGRILGAFIRDVSESQDRAAEIERLAAEVEADGAELFLAKNSLDVARRAADQGWILEDAVASVAAELETDRGSFHPFDEIIEAEPKPPPEER